MESIRDPSAEMAILRMNVKFALHRGRAFVDEPGVRTTGLLIRRASGSAVCEVASGYLVGIRQAVEKLVMFAGLKIDMGWPGGRSYGLKMPH